MQCENPNILAEDETTGLSITFKEKEDFHKAKEYEKKLRDDKAKGSLYDKIQAFLNDPRRKKEAEDFKNVLSEIGNMFKSILSKEDDIAKLAVDNPAIAATLRSIKSFDKQYVEDKIEEAKYIFTVVQEYSVIGHYLEDKVFKILQQVDNQEITKDEAFIQIRGIESFYSRISNVASELKGHIRKFIKNGNEPIYTYFSSIENSKENITSNANELKDSFVVRDIQKNIPESSEDAWSDLIRTNLIKLENAKKHGDTKRVKQLEEENIKYHEKMINEDSLHDAVSLKEGTFSKANWWSTYFESLLNNSNPIISSYVKKLYIIINKARNKMIPISTEIAKEYREFITGHSPHNLEKLYEPIYKWLKDYKYNKNTGEIESVEELALRDWYDLEKLSLHEAEWTKKIEGAVTLEDRVKIRKEYSDWKRKTYQQEYNDKILNIEKLLIPEAKEKRDFLQTQIDLLNSEINYAFSLDKASELFLLQKQKNALKYEYDENRQKKKGIDLEIALSIQAYSEAWKEVYEENTDEDTLNAIKKKDKAEETFNLYINNLKNNNGYTGKNREYVDNLVKRWKSFHETRVFKKEYKDKIKSIDTRIKEIMEELGTTRKNSVKSDEAWKKLSSIAGKYRNKDGVIEGNYLSVEELTEVKRLQKVITDEKYIAKNSYGLSMAEEDIVASIIKDYSLVEFTKDSGERYINYIRGLYTFQLPKYLETLDKTATDYELKKDKYNEDVNFLDSVHKILEDNSKAKKDDENQVALKKELSALFEEKDAIQSVETTEYYKTTYENELDKFKSLYNIESDREAKDRFENMSASENDEEEENFWYRNNHIIVERWIKDEKGSGKYQHVAEPLYSWIERKPTDENMIEYKPAYFYYERRIKDEYKNKNQELNPFFDTPLPKRGGEYDISKELDMSLRVVKFRNFFFKMYAEHQKMTKETYLRPGHFLRGLEKTKKDRVIEGQITVKKTWDTIKRAWVTNEADYEKGIGSKKESSSGINEKIRDILPLKGTTRLARKDMSYNLTEILSIFVSGSIQRNLLADEYKTFQTYYDVLKDDKGNLHLENKKINSFKKLLGKKSINTVDNTLAMAFEEMGKTIFFGEFTRDEAVGGLNLQKMASNVNMMSAINTLTWGIPSQIQNLLTAKTQAFIQANGGSLINKKDYAKGMKEYAKRIPTFMKDSVVKTVGDLSVENRMLLKWNAIQGGSNDINDGYDQTNLKQFIDSSFGGNYGRMMGEHMGQGEVAYAILSKVIVPVTDRSGNKRLMTLVDLYEELIGKHNIFRMDELLENKEVSKDYIIDPAIWSQKKEDDLMINMFTFNEKMNGLYDNILKTVFQKGALGTLMSNFRKYAIPMAVELFKGQRYDISTNKVSDGVYRTFWDQVITPLWNRRFYELNENIKDAIKNNPDGQLTENQRENFRKLAAQMSVIIAMGLLTAAIGQDPDDMKEHSFATLYLLYFSKKLKSETEQFLPLPGFGLDEIGGFFKSPSIGLAQISMYNKMFRDIGYTVFNSEKAYYQKDTLGFWKEGDSKVLADILALSVGFKGKSFYPKALISSFDYGQRNR